MAVLSHQIALRIFQEALSLFGKWAGAEIPYPLCELENVGEQAISEAKEGLVEWPTNEAINALRVVFDAIQLAKGQKKAHYWPAWAIENTENPRDPKKSYPKIPLTNDRSLIILEFCNFGNDQALSCKEFIPQSSF